MLCDDGRRCTRCMNRVQLFGCVDQESGWLGYCRECCAQWYQHAFNAALRACNRKCSVLLLRALGLNIDMSGRVRECVYRCPVVLRRSTIFRHKLQLQHVLWMSAPLYWWLEDTDSEAEEERYFQPTLRSLQEVHMNCKLPEFKRRCFLGLDQDVMRFATLLDGISAYLGGPFPSRDSPESDVQEVVQVGETHLERSWQMFWYGFDTSSRYWFFNTDTGEWFHSDNPPEHWRRYAWRTVDGGRMFWWSSGSRWFVEPPDA